MAVVRSPDFLRALNRRDCACNIDPPASSYAIMRRAGPYRGENSGPGKDDRGELDTKTRNERTQSALSGLAEMVCKLSALRGEADMRDRVISTSSVAIDPKPS